MRLQSVYEFETPDDWDEDYLLDNLLLMGHIIVFNSKEFGTLALEGTLSGYNPYHKPSIARVISRGEGWNIDFKGIIGEECVVLAPFKDYAPKFKSLIEHYAFTLAMMDTSLNQSIMNCRVAHMMACKDKASAKTVSDMVDKIYNGELTICFDKQLSNMTDSVNPVPWEIVQFNPTNAYLSDRLLADMETVIRQFDNVVGLPSVNNKKERMLTDEVETQNAGNFSLAMMCLKNMQEECNQIKKLLGCEISVKLRADTYTKENNGKEDVKGDGE